MTNQKARDSIIFLISAHVAVLETLIGDFFFFFFSSTVAAKNDREQGETVLKKKLLLHFFYLFICINDPWK